MMQNILDQIKAAIPKNWQQILAWMVLTIASAVASRYGIPIPIPPEPEPIFEPTEEQRNGGWVPHLDEVARVVQGLQYKEFADTPAGQSEDPLPDHVYLWDAYTKLLGALPPSKDQGKIGSCVSFGTNNAIARSLVCQIVIAKGTADQFKDPAEEVTYGGSRVQVGGGRINGDGSVGAWAAKFVQEWGIVSREKHGAYDLSSYSVQTCRTFGRSGVPADLQKVARERPVKDVTMVKSWGDAKKALASGYAIAVCSNQGFSMQRDANGVCRAQGSWAHCMCLDGYCAIGGKEYGHIVNSWGPSAHTGPVGPGNPGTDGFWADAGTVGRMLGQGDSFAFAAVTGWPKRRIDWFVMSRPTRLQIVERRMIPCEPQYQLSF